MESGQVLMEFRAKFNPGPAFEMRKSRSVDRPVDVLAVILQDIDLSLGDKSPQLLVPAQRHRFDFIHFRDHLHCFYAKIRSLS